MIYVVFGPTGSGKTKAALAIASFFNCPIINADAFQIYQDMDIGTAKLEKDHPLYFKHHLLDILTPEQSYSVKEYQPDFRRCLDSLLVKHQNIVVVGGTGLYIRAALFDYNFEEQDDLDVSDLEQMSNEQLWELLLELDYNSTSNLHPNNRKRVIRAIAIARNNVMTKSEIIAKQEHKIIYENVKFCFLNPPRESLYENINHRVDLMFEKGLVDEVKSLLNKYQLSMTAKQAIGYKEIIAYLEGQTSLDAAKELIKQRSRNYAKRQVTFFKHQFESDEYLDVDTLIKEVTSNV